MNQENDRTNQPSGRRLVAAAALILVSVLTLAFLEIAVRLFLPYNTPDTVREFSLEYEPAVYARNLLKPVNRLVEVDSAKAWGGKARDEPSEVSVFVNANGYRGPEFEARKPLGTTRIIVLGGSAVFDHGMSDRDSEEAGSWPHLLEKRLKKRGLENIEVINAGIPGHATADSLGRLYSQLWMYSPDLILVYHGWNDIKFWSASEITPERPLISQVAPYERGSNPFISYRGLWDRLLANSQIYVKIRNRYFLSRINVGAEGALGASGERVTRYEPYGRQQYRLNLELIVSASRIIGATPVLVTQATLVAPGNSSADRGRINYDYQYLQHDALVRAYAETYDSIRDVGTRTGTSVIDAAPKLNGRSEYFADHVHFTPQGSVALADVVADALLPILSPENLAGE